MTRMLLASKKNVILLVSVLAIIAYLVTSYQLKQSRVDKISMLGGHIEVVSPTRLDKPLYDFVKYYAKRLGLVIDFRALVNTPKGQVDTNIRAFGDPHPLFGMVKDQRFNKKYIYMVEHAKKHYGIGVNKAFMDATGMKIDDALDLNGAKFEIRAIINSLPDVDQSTFDKTPFIMMREGALGPSGLEAYAMNTAYKYRIDLRNLSTSEWLDKFQKRFPNNSVTIRRWDE